MIVLFQPFYFFFIFILSFSFLVSSYYRLLFRIFFVSIAFNFVFISLHPERVYFEEPFPPTNTTHPVRQLRRLPLLPYPLIVL